jgi:hypothetical protein
MDARRVLALLGGLGVILSRKRFAQKTLGSLGGWALDLARPFDNDKNPNGAIRRRKTNSQSGDTQCPRT